MFKECPMQNFVLWYSGPHKKQTIHTCKGPSNDHIFSLSSMILIVFKKKFLFIFQGSPHLVKTGWHDFSLSWLKGEVREKLRDFQKASIYFNVSFPGTLNELIKHEYWRESMIIGEIITTSKDWWGLKLCLMVGIGRVH